MNSIAPQDVECGDLVYFSTSPNAPAFQVVERHSFTLVICRYSPEKECRRAVTDVGFVEAARRPDC